MFSPVEHHDYKRSFARVVVISHASNLSFFGPPCLTRAYKIYKSAVEYVKRPLYNLWKLTQVAVGPGKHHCNM